jgi:hypothetical protein
MKSRLHLTLHNCKILPWARCTCLTITVGMMPFAKQKTIIDVMSLLTNKRPWNDRNYLVWTWKTNATDQKMCDFLFFSRNFSPQNLDLPMTHSIGRGRVFRTWKERVRCIIRKYFLIQIQAILYKGGVSHIYTPKSTSAPHSNREILVDLQKRSMLHTL